LGVSLTTPHTKFFINVIISFGCGGGGSRTAGDVATWVVTEVATWLETLQLSEYAENFTRHDIRGRELLTLGHRDPKELYVTKVRHMKRLLQAVRDLTM
jgi:diacylglycerol kinase (ATP)